VAVGGPIDPSRHTLRTVLSRFARKEERPMKRITVFRNKDCVRCRRFARAHRLFDWFNRIEPSTDTPATGPLVPGEIAVLDHRTGQTLQGVDAVRLIFRQVPAYWPLLPLLSVPAFARWIDREVRGCADGSCAVPAANAPAQVQP
jgi:hypothetical protein